MWWRVNTHFFLRSTFHQLYLINYIYYYYYYTYSSAWQVKSISSNLGFFPFFSSLLIHVLLWTHIFHIRIWTSLCISKKSMGECTEASAGLYGIDDVLRTVFLHVTWNSCRRFKKLCECFLWIDNFQRFKSCRNKYFIDLKSLNFERGYSTLWRIYWYGDK